jgi:hypothetical protein
MKKTFLGLSLAVLYSASQAGTILSATDVTESTMGELAPVYAEANMMNQSGLSLNYVSGVTDFDAFIAAGVTHAGGDNTSWLNNRDRSGYVVFDLGAAYNVRQFAMWNGASGISASVNGFSLSTSMSGDFGSAFSAGAFTGHQNHYGATVYDMGDSMARYVKLTIDGNFGNQCCVAIGEIAFDVTPQSSDVPEPASMALLGLGLAGLRWSRKRKYSK